ncbi:hypothetical protein [Tsukamurella tyrosinosolvens]|uniref:hypothetical protein n=1 Tax=Tsukamurella tyrosinosolvens TaxID=57704 RepID=UPI000C7F0C5D|nr:hypothetical protein [Tsukamurella tyrosinosolvens]AUN40927.1 hypothetical protein ASU32_13680 [Tsukamurella tyrosinosolvens]
MTHYIATLAIVAVFAVMAFAAEQIDRYRQLADHADQGVGADEYAGPRRYTRPTDRESRISNATRGRISNAAPRQQKVPVRSAKNTTGTTDQITQQENRS